MCICFCAPESNKADNIVIRAKLSHQQNNSSFLKLNFSSNRAGRDFSIEEASFDGQKLPDFPAEAQHIVSCSGAEFAELSLAAHKVDFDARKKTVHLKTIWTGLQKYTIEDNFDIPQPFNIIKINNLEDIKQPLAITFSEALSKTLWKYCELVINNFSFTIFSKEKGPNNNATILIQRSTLTNAWTASGRGTLPNTATGQVRCVIWQSNKRATSSFSELDYELSSEDFTIRF